MTIDRAVFAFAGIVVLTGLALAIWVHPYWVLLSAISLQRPIEPRDVSCDQEIKRFYLNCLPNSK